MESGLGSLTRTYLAHLDCQYHSAGQATPLSLIFCVTLHENDQVDTVQIGSIKNCDDNTGSKNLQKMPNVDLKVKAEVVNYDRHGFSRPELWHRPLAKVIVMLMMILVMILVMILIMMIMMKFMIVMIMRIM